MYTYRWIMIISTNSLVEENTVVLRKKLKKKRISRRVMVPALPELFRGKGKRCHFQLTNRAAHWKCFHGMLLKVRLLWVLWLSMVAAATAWRTGPWFHQKQKNEGWKESSGTRGALGGWRESTDFFLSLHWIPSASYTRFGNKTYKADFRRHDKRYLWLPVAF